MSIKIDDLMTEKVISVKPATPLVDAVNILISNKFNGLPVVNQEGVLVGLLAERDMISDDTYVHLRTLLKLLSEVHFYKKDKSPIQEDLKKILDMKVSDVMNTSPRTLFPQSSIEEATKLLADPKTNPIPIVDKDKRLVGILALSDLAKLYGVSLRSNFKAQEIDKNIDNFIHDFEKQFVLVSKFRTETWLLVSILFAVIGFVIAFMFILRINV